ncbi:MAG TPA: SAM-dependent methyltransferase [Candidatus Koribacter sp.]|jgi:SAM-dependent MidA family methyltransferase
MSLRDEIVTVIRRDGPIPFSRYMRMCLYHAELGYYSRTREKFGKSGDFYTSSDVHAVFGRLLCRQFEEMWRALGTPAQIDLIELGPGRGLFAQDVLDWAGKKFPEFAKALRYRLVESSPSLWERLRERFARDSRVALYAELEAAAEDCGEALIVFGNEFFDAIPVDIISGIGELRVAERDGNFTEEWVRPAQEHLDFLKQYSVHPQENERLETSMESQAWMQRIAALFEKRRGFAIFIDYGYTRDQQLAGRHRDTVMTFREHRASGNPYEAPGEQDITAHVNFTALIDAAEQGGMKNLGLVTQSQLLLGVGQATEFSDAFEACVLPQERAKVGLQLRHLISPEDMGERFHALVLGKGVERKLSGLEFGK